MVAVLAPLALLALLAVLVLVLPRRPLVLLAAAVCVAVGLSTAALRSHGLGCSGRERLPWPRSPWRRR